MSAGGPEITLRLENPPPCGVCDTPGLLLARFRHSWTNQRGEDVTGLRRVVLCPSCDRDNADAAQLLALFAVDGRLTEGNIATFGELAADWVESVRERSVDLDALADEEEQWRRGTL